MFNQFTLKHILAHIVLQFSKFATTAKIAATITTTIINISTTKMMKRKLFTNSRVNVFYAYNDQTRENERVKENDSLKKKKIAYLIITKTTTNIVNVYELNNVYPPYIHIYGIFWNAIDADGCHCCCFVLEN